MAPLRSTFALVAGVLVPIGLTLLAVRVGYWLVPCDYLGDAMLEHCSLQPLLVALTLGFIGVGGYFVAAAEPPAPAIHVALTGIVLTLLFFVFAYVASPSESTNPGWLLLLPAIAALPLSAAGAVLRNRRSRNRRSGSVRRTLSVLLLVWPCSGLAQSPPSPPGDHRWVVEQFFFAPGWPDKASYYTGEMKTHYADAKSMGEFGRHARRATLRLLPLTPSEVAYTVQVTQGRRAQDWYAYLSKVGKTWRLAAVRTLALPPLFFMLLDSLEATKPLPDSARQVLENMRLTASADSGLKAFFAGRRVTLEALADGFSRESARSIAAAPDGLKAPSPALRSLARQLAAVHFRGAWRDAEHPGCVFLEIGGMIDNEVGFLRCASGATPPSMSPQRFILVDAIAPGWYLYKTT